MKIGIVVPFSWSFWGAVVEHGELQAQALEARGHEVRLVMGNDPPGQFTRALHPRVGRHGDPPANVIPIGRSVIVPANGSLPNIVLSPRAILRIKRVLERERFDVLHLHEPMTPVTCISALAMATSPIVVTHHASGDLGYMKGAMPVFGFLASRIDKRLAVSERARDSAARWLPGDYEIVPNGVLIPDVADPSGREHTITFAGRQETRKGLQVLLRAWPEIHRRTGARLQVCGSDPLAVRLLLTRLRVPDDGIDILGFLPQEELTSLLDAHEGAHRPVARGREFRHGADSRVRLLTARRRVGHPRLPRSAHSRGGRPGDTRRPRCSHGAVVALLADEPHRVAMGAAARLVALHRYAWSDIAARLEGIYERAIAGAGVHAA